MAQTSVNASRQEFGILTAVGLQNWINLKRAAQISCRCSVPVSVSL